jgi:hypothetical protein
MAKEENKKKKKKKKIDGKKAVAAAAGSIDALANLNSRVQKGVREAVGGMPLVARNRDALSLYAIYTVILEAVSYIRFENYGVTLIERTAPLIVLVVLAAAPLAAAAMKSMSPGKAADKKADEKDGASGKE